VVLTPLSLKIFRVASSVNVPLGPRKPIVKGFRDAAAIPSI